MQSFRDSQLDDDSGLLVLFPGRRSGLIFALDGRRCAVAEIPSYLELNELRLELAAWETLAHEDRARQGLPPAAEQLSSRLLPAGIVACLERWKDVSIVGRDLLGPFSFELLLLPGGALLGQRLEVGYLPSMPLGTLLARRTPSANAWPLELVLIAGTELPRKVPAGASLVKIPFEPAQRERLQGGFPERVLVLDGERATPEALRGLAASARCWLIVAHGVLDEHRERTPTLLLSGG